MTTIRLLVLLAFGSLVGCTDTARQSPAAIVTPDTVEIVSISDTISRFTVDDYPVTDSMFGTGANAREIISGALRSVDKSWFVNDSLQQTLVFELYTDYHRMTTFHFSNKNIPVALLERMEFSDMDGNATKLSAVQKDFKGLLPKAERINSRYFITTKNIQLGDSVSKAIAIYGKPDNIETKNGADIYKWTFTGDNIYDGKTDLHGKPLAKDSYGHEVTLFFQNGILIAAILFNDIA